MSEQITYKCPCGNEQTMQAEVLPHRDGDMYILPTVMCLRCGGSNVMSPVLPLPTKKMPSREQKLIDLCFQMALSAEALHHGHPDVTKADWVAEQLRSCGFDTQPCGMSWGVLKDG